MSRGWNAKILWMSMTSALLGVGFTTSGQERVLGTDVSWHNRGTCSAGAAGITQTAWNTAFSTPDVNGYTRKFAYVRATRGGTTGLSQSDGTPCPHDSIATLSRRYDDPEFLRTMTRATTAGLVAGPYHFARPDNAGNTAVDEANHFMEYASAYMRPGYMMPMYDMEAGQSLGGDVLVQFSIDFSDRIYAAMKIRPCIYINGTYSGTFQTASQARRDLLAKPVGLQPSVIAPAYPMLWDARYSNNDPVTYTNIPVQTGSPKNTFTTVSSFYGPWDDYGDTEPWSFWQYASVVAIPGFPDANVDGNVSHGDIEYVKNYLVPAVWWNDNSGDWNTLTNWNSGQPLSTFNTNDINNPPAPYVPRVGPGQTTPFTSYTLPAPRLPGAAGTGPASTSGVHDTLILERPTANIAVTLSSGTYNLRKLYMRETLNITGGSLTVNYDPTYRPDNNALVLHGGPISAQFSGPVTLVDGTLNIHTLQVDTNRTFTLGGGTLAFNKINLMQHATLPGKIVITNGVTINPLSNVTAVITNGAGSGSGVIDLGGGNRTFTVGNGTNAIDLSVHVPINNGGLVKSGGGTMRLAIANNYTLGTTVSLGTLLVNNPTGSGTGTGGVTVSGGTLGGSGLISGAVSVNSGGTISPGASAGTIGTLTLSSTPTFGGTIFMEINRNGGSPLADRLARSGGTLNYGGTLVVSNIGATLVGGEVFTNFTATAFTGAFANTNLPPLNAGLNWYLGSLVTNGTIKVNRQPAANPVTFTNDAPTVLQIPIASLIANDTDPDGDAISVASINLTTTNGVTLTTNGTFIFYSNYVSVADQFTYTISDGRGGSATGLVQIASNRAGRFAGSPTATGDSVTLHFVGSPGWTYYLERSTNLPVWLTISTNVAPPSGLFDYTDDFQNMGESSSSAFYRLRWDP